MPEVLEDFLEVDEPVPGQNFYCLSVVNPEGTLKKKEEFLFYHYYKLKMEEHMARLKSNVESTLKKGENGTVKVKDLVHLNKNMVKGFELDTISFSEFKEKYEDYIFTKSQEVSEEFDKTNNFQTSVRGIKVRGTYDTHKEAEARAKSLQKRDPTFDVYVAPVGYWVPTIVNTNHIENQEHSNDELNKLMKSYKENETNKNLFYEERKQKMKEKAVQEYKQKQKELEEEANKSKQESLEKVEEVKEVEEANEETNTKHELDETSIDNVLNNNAQVNETITHLQEEDPWLARKTASN